MAKTKKAKPCESKNAVIVIASSEPSMANSACDDILDELLDRDQRETCLYKADPDKITVSEVLDELRTLPFLADKRVVLLKQADKFITTYRPVLEKYFDSPATKSTLIMTVSSWRSNTKLAKKLSNIGRLIEISQPRANQIPPMLIAYARKKHNKTLTSQAAYLIVEYAGQDMASLYNELDKLVLYAGDQDRITEDNVRNITSKNRSFNTFEVIDAMLSGNAAKAITALRALMAEDKSAPYMATGAFAYQFRKMFSAKALLLKGMYPKQVAQQVGIWSNTNSVFAQLNKTSLQKLGTTISKLAMTDYKIKTGQTTPLVALEQLILEYAC